MVGDSGVIIENDWIWANLLAVLSLDDYPAILNGSSTSI